MHEVAQKINKKKKGGVCLLWEFSSIEENNVKLASSKFGTSFTLFPKTPFVNQSPSVSQNLFPQKTRIE